MHIGCGSNEKKNSTVDCFELCEQTTGCKGFSWLSSQHTYCPKGCFLKYEMKNRQNENHVISGHANKDKGIKLCLVQKYIKDVNF